MRKIGMVLALFCLAAPAMAADWNFYGSARMATFYLIVIEAIAAIYYTLGSSL